MPIPVLLPRQGNTVETCVIVRWLKQAGEAVREGEPIVEVETDKATMEIESPATGTLLELLFPEGANVAPAPSRDRSPLPEFPGPNREVAFTGTRRVIAERMRQSLEQAAQLTLHAAADISGLAELRGRLNAQRQATGQERLSLNDFVLLAASRVLREYRVLNAHCLADRVIEFEPVHLGMAVETRRGLLVPAIRFAERLELDALAAEARRLAHACREGTIRPEELQGGTFTVTNLGALGIEIFTPILNPPEVAILGVGGIQHRPRLGHPADLSPHLLFSLTFDHRALDGAPTARFLGRLAQALAQIDLLVAGSLPEAQPTSEDSNCSPPCPNP